MREPGCRSREDQGQAGGLEGIRTRTRLGVQRGPGLGWGSREDQNQDQARGLERTRTRLGV